MAEPSPATDADSVDAIRTKEAETAANLKNQEDEDKKYRSEPTEKTTFKHYRVR